MSENVFTFMQWIIRNHPNVILEFMKAHNMSFIQGEEE